MGGPEMAPQTPNARRAPAQPGRSSNPHARGATASRAPLDTPTGSWAPAAASGLRCGARVRRAPREGGEEGGGEPDPQGLAREHGEAPRAEKAADAERRDDDRPPRQVIASRVERCPERDADAAIGHRIEDAVRRRREEQVPPQPTAPRPARKQERREHGGKSRREGERVGQATMAEDRKST